MMKNIFTFCFLGMIGAACSLNTMSMEQYEQLLAESNNASTNTNTITPSTNTNIVGTNTNVIDTNTNVVDTNTNVTETNTASPVPPVLNTSVYYGRSILSGEELKAYDYMFDRFRNFESNKDQYGDIAHRVYYDFTSQGIKLTSSSQVNTILAYIVNDHPEFYQAKLSAARSLATQGGYVTTFYNLPMAGTISREQFNTASQEIETVVVRMLGVIKAGMSDAQKIRALHDVFLTNVNYSMSTTARVSDAYGALVQQKALCEGYARAFAYLLQRAGIKAFYNTGQMRSGETTSDWGMHAWVIVNLDGGWYAIDITGDDGIGGFGFHYSYFLMGATDFSKTLRYVDDAGVNYAAYSSPALSPTNYPLAATAY